MTHEGNETALSDAVGRPGEASPPVRPGHRFSTDDRRRLLGIDDETLALVRGAAPILRDNVDRIVKEFYRRVLLVKPLVELATTHSSVERLSETLREYILDFADTTLDAAHVASRERIAAVHDRIDLPVDAYLAQLQAIRQVWTEIVFETAGKHKRSVKESLRLVTALDKLLAFDEGTVCLFFMDTRQRRVEEVLARVEAQHEAQQAVQGELTLLADELAGASEESSASVQEMTATAEQVAGEVSAAASQSQAATATAKEGLIAVHAAEASVESVRAATEQLARSAEELDGSSAKIEQIATSLAETADQINLLALNAAIEAARAGDVGRGFTVVADEVRRLAESTQRRLGEANSAVREMRASVDDVRTAGQGAAGQVASLGETTASVRGRFDEITVAVEAMATSLDAIAAASGQVASAASDTGHGSGEVARLATEVKAVADRLAGE